GHVYSWADCAEVLSRLKTPLRFHSRHVCENWNSELNLPLLFPLILSVVDELYVIGSYLIATTMV
ncbi:MAG: hypothetical protein ACYSX1_13430, partial [Planctomycetota bacterium]